jgi:hypothetical protein
MEQLTDDEKRIFLSSSFGCDLVKLGNQLIRNTNAGFGYGITKYSDIVLYFTCDTLCIRLVHGWKRAELLRLYLRQYTWIEKSIDFHSDLLDIFLDKSRIVEAHEITRHLIEETQREYEKYLGNLDIFNESLGISEDLVNNK